jgi:uncharacterized membrane protein YfcA
MLSSDLPVYVALGFAAQLVDGALGMAYGLLCTSALLATGAPPAIASASVHAAEVVTTGLAGGSHLWHRNVDWRLFRRLAPAGVAGGTLGAYVLTELPLATVKLVVAAYLICITALITWRVFTGRTARQVRWLGVAPVGAGGGFLDAIGGGGWGPIVTSTLVARGEEPRHAVGSSSLAEFLVTAAISATFLATLDFAAYGRVVLGLIIGGALAAPLAGWFCRVLPQRVLLGAVAVVVGGLATHGLVRLAGG